MTCILILVVVNFVAFNFNSAIGEAAGEFNTQNTVESARVIIDNLNDTSVLAPVTGAVSTGKIIAGILLWTFGVLPLWLDLLLSVIRIIAVVSIIGIVRGA